MFRKRTSFFYSIFIPILLAGIFLIGSFSIYIYRDTAKNIKDKLVEERLSFARQVKNNLEQRVRTVEYAFTTYSTTGDFDKLLQTPLDYRDFSQVKEVRSELTYFGIMGIEDTRYTLISLAQHWKITDHESLKYITDEEAKVFETLVTNSNENLFWIPKGESIRMIISLPTFSSPRLGVGIADINKSVIERVVGEDNKGFFNIYNSEGTLLFHNDSEVNQDLKQKIMSIGTTTRVGTIFGKHGDIYAFSRSNYNDWIYVAKLGSNVVKQATMSLIFGLVSMSILGLSLLVMIAYLVADRSTEPIRVIRDRLKIERPNERKGRNSEINEVLMEIDDIVSANTDLVLNVQRQRPELEQLFVLNLFRQRVFKEDLPKRLSQYGYQLSDKVFYVMLIQIDDLSGREENNRDIFLLALEKLVEEIIPADERLRPIILNSETQATILTLSSTNESEKNVLAYCNQVQTAAQEYLRIKVSFGISNAYQELLTTKAAAETAKEALHFRINIGQEAIIFFREVELHAKDNTNIRYPIEEEEKLLDAIRLGNEENIELYFNSVLGKIFSENNNPMLVEMALFRLTNNIIQLGQLIGTDFETLLNHANIYKEILNTDNRKKIYHILMESLIRPLVYNTQDRTNHELQSLTDKMIHLVHQQYDQDLSLEMLADQLHYNPNYLSTLFKKRTGQNFIDYLQQYRLEVAKRWLKETNMTVKEISQRLCYTNPQNFIRFFKKKERMTPGEYRKL
ncbi:AraC family transcriptional regulator [Enterococcus nangangensis]|uniref:AraC family transcriptional regulator n=1 Tax=Enterococcus nangangensis TaxID=2559926 RepID=UPI0010F43A7C|nr:AraC family transcriptional regulator [Enterococcus nangangensis]